MATSGHEEVIRLWRWPEWEPAGELTGHTGLVGDLQFDPEGIRLYSAGHDGTMRVWDVAEARLVATMEHGAGGAVAQLDVSPDGQRVVSVAGDGSRWLRLWDVRSAQLLMSIPCAVGWMSACFTGDGRRLLAADNGGRLSVFEAPGYEPVIRKEAGGASARD